LFAYINYVTKDKSNHWIYDYIRTLAKTKYNKDMYFLSSLNKRNLLSNDVILLVDDCIYSGNQMSSEVYTIRNKYQTPYRFILFVTYFSDYGLDMVKTAFEENSNLKGSTLELPKYRQFISPLGFYMEEEEYATMAKYQVVDPNNLREYVKRDMNKFPLYFDHKIADWMSTFPDIFSGLVPNSHNLEILKQKNEIYGRGKGKSGPAPEEWLKELKVLNSSFEMYPLITHCEHIKVPEFLSSSCPAPPYKIAFTKFIKSARKQNRSHRSASITRYGRTPIDSWEYGRENSAVSRTPKSARSMPTRISNSSRSKI